LNRKIALLVALLVAATALAVFGGGWKWGNKADRMAGWAWGDNPAMLINNSTPAATNPTATTG